MLNVTAERQKSSIIMVKVSAWQMPVLGFIQTSNTSKMLKTTSENTRYAT
jgi:hypothetical protein